MRLFTSSTKYVPLACFAVTFGLLLLTWESIIRANYNPPLNITYEVLERIGEDSGNGRGGTPSRRCLILGNCLSLQGLSPRIMREQWQRARPGSKLPLVFNLSRHEHPPQAFLAYFQMHGFCPDVIIANVSSWINADSFNREIQGLERSDPLGLRVSELGGAGPVPVEVPISRGRDDFPKRIESELDRGVKKVFKLTEKRYHLFDFSIFLGTLLSTGDLKASLYDLNLQSWFKVTGSVDDGLGYRGMRVEYGHDWHEGVRVMASKHLRRLTSGRFLTPRYWQTLTDQLDHFRRHGTKIVLVRMPEYSAIHHSNEARYQITEHLYGLAKLPGIAFLDLNTVEPLQDVKLYDAVHPDRESSIRISEYVAKWLADYYPDWIYAHGSRTFYGKMGEIPIHDIGISESVGRHLSSTDSRDLPVPFPPSRWGP